MKCMAACDQTEACDGFDYVGGKCWFKTGKASTEEHSNPLHHVYVKGELVGTDGDATPGFVAQADEYCGPPECQTGLTCQAGVCEGVAPTDTPLTGLPVGPGDLELGPGTDDTEETDDTVDIGTGTDDTEETDDTVDIGTGTDDTSLGTTQPPVQEIDIWQYVEDESRTTDDHRRTCLISIISGGEI